MQTSLTAIICSLSMLFLLTLSMGSCAQDTKDVPKVTKGKELIETKCQQCHSLERVKQAHLDLEKARQVVERMRQKEGANISKDEAEVIYNALGDYFTVAPAPAVIPAPIK